MLLFTVDNSCFVQIHIIKLFRLEWVSDCCLTPNEYFSAISWREQVTCDEMMVMYALDQHLACELK